MGSKLQTTFFHSVIGLPILPDDLHYVGRLVPKGTGVEMEPSSIFKQTAAIHTPSLTDMMKVNNMEELENLAVDTSVQRKRVKQWATLTPTLYQALKATDMKPASAFMKIVEAIKTTITLSPENAEETEEELLVRVGTPYTPVLRFIWTFLSSPDKILAPTAAPLQDDETITWEKETAAQSLERRALLPRREVVTPALSTDGAITAMTKLSERLVKNQEAALKASEEKADNRLKAWKKLPKIQQDTILLGGVDESGGVPEELTEEMLSILGCSNGAQVEQFLR